MKTHITHLFILALLLLTSCRDITPDTIVSQHGKYTYCGTVKNGRYDGYGTLSIGDSMIYAGQWHGGKRSGKGVSHDSLHHRIVGTWRADTLVRGTWTDSTGTYSGEMNRDAIAHGHGSFADTQQGFYSGQWRDGQRTGFGFAILPKKHLRIGEWSKNRFLGERLEYTADRIYGIDLSRFQHDVGRRHYPIDWSRLRIAHLGTISHKRVRGKVDYPVSFCYIKSTGHNHTQPLLPCRLCGCPPTRHQDRSLPLLLHTYACRPPGTLLHSQLKVLEGRPASGSRRGADARYDKEDGRTRSPVPCHTHMAAHRRPAHRNTPRAVHLANIRQPLPPLGTRPQARLQHLDSPLRRVQA